MNDGIISKSPYASASNGLAGKTHGKADAAKETVLGAKDKVVEISDKAMKGSKAALEKTKAFVTTRPLTAIAIAFGVGYIGMRLSRLLR